MNWMPKRSIPLLLALPVAALLVIVGMVIGCDVTFAREGSIWMNLEKDDRGL